MRRQDVMGTALLGAAGVVGAMALRRARGRGFSFAGRSVLITGGSRGLGLVMARQLVAEGARVTLLARESDELDRAAADLRQIDSAAQVLTVRADVRQRRDVEYAVELAIGRFGRIDVVINNAGVIQTGPLDHMTLADYENAMNTHFWGPLHVTLAVLPHMRRQHGGRIVNISSIGGRIAVPHMLPYSASKFALTGLSDGLRAELAREKILVTTVFPGLMRTGSPPNATFKGRHEEEYAWFATASSTPGITIAAERAARQILAATRRGDAEVVLTVVAKLAILARAIVPETCARAMRVTDAMLPSATGPAGDVPKRGRDSESEWAPSGLTAPTYAAARRNNEL